MTQQHNLLNKYYKGESSQAEEKTLRSSIQENDNKIAEQDIFEYFDNEAAIPEGLEDDIFAGIQTEVTQKKNIRMRIYSMVSAAAVVLILLSVFLDVRSTKKMQMEDNFFVMEQALFQMSESLQPAEEQDEMLVLWVDDDVEIILN